MRILSYLARSATVLNGLLIALIVTAVVSTLSPLLRVKVAINAAPGQEVTAGSEGKSTAEQVPSLSEFMVVAEQNLFHPERRIPPEKSEKELPKPEIVLYGTLMAGEMSVAYLEDKKAPYSTPGRGKRQITVKKGDTVSGFVVREIQTNKIVLTRGDETMTVFLNDAKVRGGEAARPGSPAATSSGIIASPPVQAGFPGVSGPTPSPSAQAPSTASSPGLARPSLNDSRQRAPSRRPMQ
jgi:hypothetical protein